MIRRSPTRIELKLEDMQEIEFVQKSDRRKAILAACTGIEEAKKLLRQERIGYPGPPSRPGATSGITGAPPRRQPATSTVSAPPRPATAAAQVQAQQATTAATPSTNPLNTTAAAVIDSEADMDLVDMSIDSPSQN